MHAASSPAAAALADGSMSLVQLWPSQTHHSLDESCVSLVTSAQPPASELAIQ